MSRHPFKKVLMAILCLVIIAPFFPYTNGASANTTLRVAVNTNMPPYQFLDSEGAVIGIHIDLLNSIADKKAFQVEYISCSNDIQAMDLLKMGEADVVLGTQTQVSTSDGFDQVGELSSSMLYMIASNEVHKEINRNTHLYFYTMVTDCSTNITIARAHLDNTDFGKAMRIITANSRLAFQELENRRAQIAIIDKETVLYYLEEANRSNAYTILNSSLTSVTYTMLVHKDNRALQRMLETALSDLRLSGEYAQIMEKWVGNPVVAILKKMEPYIAAVALVVLAYLACSTYINRTLKRKVREKTDELLCFNQQLEKRMHQLSTEKGIRNALIETLASAIVIFDETYAIQLFNQSTCRIADKQIEAGDDIRELNVFREALIHAEDRWDIFSEDMRGLQSPAQFTVQDGGTKKTYRYAVYSFYEYEISRSMLVLLEDITDEENARQQIQEAEKSRSLNMLIAGMAHEIKNPLMAIQTYTAAMSQQIDNPDFRTSFTKYMPLEVNRINRLIESLINYARPTKGVMERLDIAAVVNEALYLVEATIVNKPIRLDVHLEEGIYIFANRDKMKQALINFAVNGIESMEKKINVGTAVGTLIMRIAMYVTDKQVSLHIRDEGTGMSAEAIHHCTDPFFTTKSTGTGLGMSLARQFVEDNGGTLSIHSEEGVYTEIILTWGRLEIEAENTDH